MAKETFIRCEGFPLVRIQAEWMYSSSVERKIVLMNNLCISHRKVQIFFFISFFQLCHICCIAMLQKQYATLMYAECKVVPAALKFLTVCIWGLVYQADMTMA